MTILEKPKTKKFLLPYLVAAYALIYLQYPIGVTLSRLVLHSSLETTLQPNYLLVWGLVRILVVLPLIFTLIGILKERNENLFLSLGDKKNMISYMFWGTFAFTILGLLLYPVFLNQSKLNLVNILYLFPIFLTYATANALAEETFFRSISLSLFSERFNFPIANVLQAIFYALIHFTMPGITSKQVLAFVVLTFFLGLFWGWATKKTKSLIPAVIMHIVCDIFVAMSLF